MSDDTRLKNSDDTRLKNLIAIVLTYNSQISLPLVLDAVTALANRVIVVDSYSQDDSCKIASKYGCDVVQHEFIHYGQQRNWAQTYASATPQDWFLHLDSDEVITKELADSIHQEFACMQTEFDGYLIRRLVYFLGHPIRFGHTNPSWHLRLFRATSGVCENRLYDQHFIVAGKVKRLNGLLLDMQSATLEQWTQSHNRWSSAEARQLLLQKHDEQQLPAVFWTRDIRQRKRWWKNKVYYLVPCLLRAFLLFFYSYILRLGFLDGKIGLVYHILQAFWFRFLVDAKIMEAQLANSQNSSAPNTVPMIANATCNSNSSAPNTASMIANATCNSNSSAPNTAPDIISSMAKKMMQTKQNSAGEKQVPS